MRERGRLVPFFRAYFQTTRDDIMASKLKPYKEQIQQMILEGQTLTEIAKALETNRDRVKYFVKHYGIERPEETRAQRNEQKIIELIKAGHTARETIELSGMSKQSVYLVKKKHGLEFARNDNMKSACEPCRQRVIEMFRNGHTNKEIANAIGVSKEVVKHFIKRLPEYTEELKQQRIEKSQASHSEEHVAQAIREANPNLEYVSGYTRKQDPVNVRCLNCGEAFSINYHTIVHQRGGNCPRCKAETRRQRQAEREAKHKARAAERERKRRLAIKTEQMSFNICPTCGEVTTRKKYCGDRCRNRAYNKAGEIRRRTKIAKAMVDADITVEGLYKRDKGVCHICKGRCDLEDYVVTEQTIVCGDWYPSIDHVKPLSKGGLHSWENVKLAHRICNSRKSAVYAPPLL